MTHENHSIDVVFSGSIYGPEVFLRCDADDDALCHAVYRCHCKEWDEEEVIAGVPRHKSWDDVTHVGHFEDPCKLDDWFLGNDNLEGVINRPVKVEWVDGYDFILEDK